MEEPTLVVSQSGSIIELEKGSLLGRFEGGSESEEMKRVFKSGRVYGK